MTADAISLLLVEDNPGDALLLKTVLAEARTPPFDVTGVEYLQDAIRSLQEGQFDVVVLDLSLPDCQGLDSFLLVQSASPTVPILVLTGTDDEQLALEAVRSGAQDYVTKEMLDARLLVRAIRYSIERKRFEETQRKSDELLERMFANTHVMLAYLDTGFRFIRVNRAYAEANGYTTGFLVGKSYHDLFGDPEVIDVFGEVLETGKTHVAYEKSFEMAGIRDGDVTYWDWSVQPVKEADGSTGGLILSILEVTERKHLQDQLFDVSVAERQRIGQDLHDALGQNLTGIAFLSKVLEQRLSAKNLPDSEDAAEISRLVDEAVSQTRLLAKGLCPVEPSADGLMVSLKALAAHTEKVFDISCRFVCDSPILVHDNTQATHLYHIAQEAVNNAIKHGNAKNIQISLTSADDKVTLKAADDGIGIAENPSGGNGMGLQIMQQRARTMNADLHVSSPDSGGTVMECSFSAGNS